MGPRIAFAVLVALPLTAQAAAAACPVDQPKAHQAKKHQNDCVNLSAVPQISAQVVAGEPMPAVKAPTYTPPPAEQYQGPMLNLTKPDPGVKPVPTVGYHWSLE